ncbi:MAG: pyridoxamine 5'-phosphate oxidase [Planctomycetes bacterium]|nr:pyridoxamine 5'-phosphate oxidase [Planctomycetota bacterium]
MPSDTLSLLEANAPPNPLELFAQWYLAAQAAQILEPSAMTLATATADGQPSARMVLMRGFDERGFTFYTNYLSRKAGELAQNPRVALVFHWPQLERQVRIEGGVEKVSVAESDAYFRSRPFGHKLGAHASDQSEVIASRQVLEDRLNELLKRFHENDDVPRPEHWGGYRVLPRTIEFWQGQANRLHDRLRYQRIDGGWKLDRLGP